jgi:hypothetical protein
VSNLDRYFDDLTEKDSHPKLRYWLQQLESGRKATFELHRPNDILGFKPAKMYVHFYENEEEVGCDSEDWEDSLNNALIKHCVRAITKENEIMRFSLTFRDALRPAQERFGEGYFNAVLLEIIKDKSFSEHKSISEKMEHIADSKPCKDSPSYEDCREMIEYAIKVCAQNLTKYLKYTRDEAEEILLESLAQYLDERFSVTNRYVLGLI